jgi:hypothetical protein
MSRPEEPRTPGTGTNRNVVPLLDTTVAHPARRYDYWLGGKDNFQADRDSGDAIARIWPHIRTAARANRDFLHRAARYLVAEAGIRQFLDIGTGLPTADNTHDIVQRLAPDSRVLYVDNDPLVLVHARALLTSHPAGATDYLQADLRDPTGILNHPTLADTLDLTKPVALMLVAVLHFLRDTDHPHAIVRTLMDALPPGSHLVLSHASADLLPAPVAAQLATADIPGRGDFTDRTRGQIEAFFDRLDVVKPGIQIVSQWRAEPCNSPPPPEEVSVYGGIGRKPEPEARQ